MTEKYGVELEAKTSGFTKAIDTLINRIETFGKRTDEIAHRASTALDTQAQEIDFSVYKDTIGDMAKETEKEIATVEKRLQELEEMLNVPFGEGIDKKAKDEYDQLVEKLITLKKELEETRKLQDDVLSGKGANGEDKSKKNPFKNLADGIEKSTKKVMKFTLAMFGVRSGLTILSRAMSSYLSQDRELQDKMNAMWTGLGVVIAPIVEYIADAVLTLTKYIIYITEALTKIPLLQNAIDKTTKQMTRSLSSLDEITNIGEQNSIMKLQELLEGKEINTEFADKIVAVLKPVYDIIAGIVEFASKHPDIIAIILGGWAITKLIATIIGSGTLGLAGIALGLSVIAGMSIANIIDQMNDLNKSIKNNTEAVEGLIEKEKEINRQLTEKQEEGEFIPGSEEANRLLDTSISHLETLQAHIKSIQDEKYWWNFWQWGELDKQIEGVQEEIELTQQRIEQLGGQRIEIEVDLNTKKAENSWASLFAKTLALGPVGLGTSLGQMVGKKIASFDVGTNYVEQDQLAMIHEGEAIIPKRFNNEQYFSNINNNSETNALLVELINAVNEGNAQGQSISIDGKALAEVTYGYYQAEGVRLNTNSSVRRG